MVVTLSGLIAGTAGAYYLTARVAAARTEARLLLHRDAAFVTELVARDLRQADEVKAEPDAHVVRIGASTVRYHLDDGRLVRDTGAQAWLLTPRATSFTLVADGLGYRAELALERPFARGGPVRLSTAIEVGRRSR